MREQAGPGLVRAAGTVGHRLQPRLQVSVCALVEGMCACPGGGGGGGAQHDKDPATNTVPFHHTFLIVHKLR